MTIVVEQGYDCPYCWEPNVVFVDTAQGDQELIEDCTVCCRPIRILVAARPGSVDSIAAEPG